MLQASAGIKAQDELDHCDPTEDAATRWVLFLTDRPHLSAFATPTMDAG